MFWCVFFGGFSIKKVRYFKKLGHWLTFVLYCVNKKKGAKGFVWCVCVGAWHGVGAWGVGGGGGVGVWGVAKS